MNQNKGVLLSFLLLMVGSVAFSQATTNSPYSKYGVGVIRPQSFAANFGMGGVGKGLRSTRDLNLSNPASYSAITVTTFDVGYTNNALWMDDGVETQYQNNPYIDHLAFAFPMVKKVWGMSFGFLPYSNVGYKYDEVITDSIAGNVSFYNEGDGAINKAYFGNAIAFKLDSTSNLSIGANAYFLFGSITHDQKVIYGDLPNAINLWKKEDLSITDFGFDFGLQYQKKWTKENVKKNRTDHLILTLGATYGLASDLGAKQTVLTRTFTGTADFGTVKDTVTFVDEVDVLVQLPAEIGAGISLEKENKWLIAFDYKTSDWGAIATNSDLYSYQSLNSFALGGQFIPKYNSNNYLMRMAYRIGARYSDSHLVINDQDWTESGITFGLGFPVRKSENSYPRLNLGFEYGSRGTTDAGLIEETFFNFNIGVTINATWFGKRKYN